MDVDFYYVQYGIQDWALGVAYVHQGTDANNGSVSSTFQFSDLLPCVHLVYSYVLYFPEMFHIQNITKFQNLGSF